jgi:uncharacterized membrane protein YoaT (DUF817 family)
MCYRLLKVTLAHYVPVFLAHVVSSLAYLNLLGNKRLIVVVVLLLIMHAEESGDI